MHAKLSASDRILRLIAALLARAVSDEWTPLSEERVLLRRKRLVGDFAGLAR